MSRRSDRSSGSQFIRAYTMRDGDWTREAPGSEVPFTASTGVTAKDQMALRPERWKVDNYHRSGGPVLWQHEHSRPAIGNGRAIVEPKRLRIHVTFDQEDDFAKAIESKLRRRVLRSSSVGWCFVDEAGNVLANQRVSPYAIANQTFQSLDEMSVVNVGSDPFAVAERAAQRAQALSAISPTLLELFDAQERTDSDVTGPELRRAVIDYCNHIGLDLRYIRAAVDDDADEVEDTDGELSEDDAAEAGAETEDVAPVRRSRLPERVRSHGVELPGPAQRDLKPAVSTVDGRAAQTVLAAFGLR